VGAAAVIGFVTATQVLAPPDHRAPAAPLGQGQGGQPSLMASLFEMGRSALVSTIIGALHSSSQPSGQEQQVAGDPSSIP
jgi:hypothetical protein